MKAMILAAGQGNRLRPLTDKLPKPLIEVAGRPLIEHHVLKLVAGGIGDIVINLSYLSEQIRQFLGDGQHYGCRIHYSPELPQAYGTAGGVRHALELFGEETQLLICNADVISDIDYQALSLQPGCVAHWVMVPNPPDNPAGDYGIRDGRLAKIAEPKLTFSGVGVYHKRIFSQLIPGQAHIPRVLDGYPGQVSAEVHHGKWYGINHIETLQLARANY